MRPRASSRAVLAPILAFCLAGCAIVRDPLPPHAILVAGWGRVTVVHDRRANGDEETFIERDINTKDVIMATVAGLSLIHISEPTRPY